MERKYITPALINYFTMSKLKLLARCTHKSLTPVIISNAANLNWFVVTSWGTARKKNTCGVFYLGPDYIE